QQSEQDGDSAHGLADVGSGFDVHAGRWATTSSCRLSLNHERHRRGIAYTGDGRCRTMAPTSTIAFMMMSLMALFSVEYNDPWQFVGNVIETAIGFLILGILALIYLLGLIPNPFPWMLG
ncbi:MAG: hypothetical protein VXY67_04855, partial [Candidatus Thermoplasmatota archaeon]|nr:hypothetical protein [Candidatus Thermoplasmatota archaeon]